MLPRRHTSVCSNLSSTAGPTSLALLKQSPFDLACGIWRATQAIPHKLYRKSHTSNMRRDSLMGEKSGSPTDRKKIFQKQHKVVSSFTASLNKRNSFKHGVAGFSEVRQRFDEVRVSADNQMISSFEEEKKQSPIEQQAMSKQ